MKNQLKRSGIVSLILIVLLIVFTLWQGNTHAVEIIFSRGWYPVFSYIPGTFFGYLPFSIGDIFYCTSIGFLVFLTGQTVCLLFKKKFYPALLRFSKLINLGLLLYLFFYISWGMNYYRQSVALNADIRVDSLKLADYLEVLDRFIDTTNTIRGRINPEVWKGKGRQIEQDMVATVENDTTFRSFLSVSNVRAKSPLNSRLVSYVGVSGYFNPFTHEAHVNTAMPEVAKPFTYVHELAHQQGIGFEDEANFIAFVRLQHHPNEFYRYSAYLQCVTYMLSELRGIDRNLFKQYRNRLSAKIESDLEEERAFWKAYMGWINDLTALFYNQYLQHNNQAEGIARYNRMTRLVLAYELQNKGCR